MMAIQMKSESLGTTERQRGWRKPFGERGQTFVEFALIASAFLLLLFSIMWLSLAVSATAPIASSRLLRPLLLRPLFKMSRPDWTRASSQ